MFRLKSNKEWFDFLEKATRKMKENGLDLDFSNVNPKDNYSHAKLNVAVAVNLAFAQTHSDNWVELELLARTKNKVRKPQVDLYVFLEDNYERINCLESREITWDEKDIATTSRKSNSAVMRIKIYRDIKGDNEWIDDMVCLAKGFLPALKKWEEMK